MYPDHSDAMGNADAIAVCGICPLKQGCGDGALARREAFGVWGGLTEARRRSIIRHGEVPAHVVPAPKPVTIRREKVARLAAAHVPVADIAAQLDMSVDLVHRDLQRLRDHVPQRQKERAASKVAQAAELDRRIDAMLQAGSSINRIVDVLHVSRRTVYRRREHQAARTLAAAA
jgi:DNA invertase Pin-like site-specific DNA recombinase